MSLSDRIAVMFDGQIMGERDPAQTDERELGLLMAGIAGEPDKPDWKAVEENLEAVEHGEAPKHG
jgi:simple sugar transport system ATP-binding protein